MKSFHLSIYKDTNTETIGPMNKFVSGTIKEIVSFLFIFVFLI
jgi:hypothetical protein